MMSNDIGIPKVPEFTLCIIQTDLSWLLLLGFVKLFEHLLSILIADCRTTSASVVSGLGSGVHHGVCGGWQHRRSSFLRLWSLWSKRLSPGQDGVFLFSLHNT